MEKCYQKSKILRRALAVLLVLSGVLGSLSTASAAAGPALYAEYMPGGGDGRARVDIVLYRPADIAGLQFSVKYDASKLSVAEVTKGAALNGWYFNYNTLARRGEIKIACASSTGLKLSGPVTVCSIVFDGIAASGNASVSIHSLVAGNSDAKRVAASVKGAAIFWGGTQPDSNALALVQTLAGLSAALEGNNEDESVRNIAAAGLAAAEAIRFASSSDNAASVRILNASVRDMIDSVAAAAKGFRKDESLIEANRFFTGVMSAAGGALTPDTDKDSLDLTAGTARAAVRAAGAMAGYAQTPETALAMAREVIPPAALVAVLADQYGGKYNGIENELVRMAERTAQQAGTAALAASSGSAGTFTASEAQVLEAADRALAAAASLEQNMRDSGLSAAISAGVMLTANTNADTRLELPGSLLPALSQKGIGSVKLRMGATSLTLPAGLIGDAQDTPTLLVTFSKSAAAGSAPLGAQIRDVFDIGVALRRPGAADSALTSFDRELEIELPYTPADSEDPGIITALRLTGGAAVQNMCGRFDAAAGTVVFRTRHLSQYAPLSLNVEFSDVPQTHWAGVYIKTLAAKGIVGAKAAADKYRPDEPITRAEFARYLTTALGVVDDSAPLLFSDVNSAGDDRIYIASAAKYGIVNGIGDGKFGPDMTITREDAAVMLTRALTQVYLEKGVTSQRMKLTFADAGRIASYAADAVANSVWNGLMDGKSGNLFDPKGSITRAEAATVIYRLYNR